MITGVMCKCECNKEFVINISETNDLDTKSMKIYNKLQCPKCNDKNIIEDDNE